MQKWLGSILVLLFTSFKSILKWILVTVFEKINVLLINTVLGQVSIIANVNFSDSFWENQCFIDKHCFRPK